MAERLKEASSSRARVRLALAHLETDRIPIAMVCAGVNLPAYRANHDYGVRVIYHTDGTVMGQG